MTQQPTMEIGAHGLVPAPTFPPLPEIGIWMCAEHLTGCEPSKGLANQLRPGSCRPVDVHINVWIGSMTHLNALRLI